MSTNIALSTELSSDLMMFPRTPEIRLLQALESGDLEEFEKELKNGLLSKHVILIRVYDKFMKRSVLEIACSSVGKSKFVETLIKNGASVNSINKSHGTAPLHLAVQYSDIETVQVLLNDPFINVNIHDSEGNTPLHIAAITNKVNIIELLLQQPAIRINETNRKGQTPLHAALAENSRSSVLALMKHIDVDLDEIRDITGETCRGMVQSKFPDMAPLSSRSNSSLRKSETPFTLLRRRDLNTFMRRVKANKNSLNQNDDGPLTYLQYASKYGLLEVVQTLLNHGADPNRTTEFCPQPPIVIAVSHGHLMVVRALIEFGVSFNAGPEGTILHSILKTILLYDDILDPHQVECLEYILKKISPHILDVNHPDANGNTVLHLAAKLNNPKMIRVLLDHGAYLGFKNVLGEMPVSLMCADILRSYLDDCVEDNGKQPIEEKYEIIYKYNSLVPSEANEKNGNEFNPGNDSRTSATMLEMEPLIAMSKSDELRPLLRHPVMTSFLNLKWYTIRKYVWINMVAYFVFWLLLMLYTSTITMELWGPVEQSSKYRIFQHILPLCILGLGGVLFLREFFQFAVSPQKYATHLENWLELILLGVTFSTLIYNASAPFLEAFAVLLSSIKMVFLLGRHPHLSTQIEMFKLVSINFLKFFLLYSILILAFSCAFMSLFHGKRSNVHHDKRGLFFENLDMSMFKTFIMLTGEFELGSIPFERNYGISHFIFIIFVFLVSIVLYNLLSGLAVSDIQRIRSNAQLIAIESIAKMIGHIEFMGAGDPFRCFRLIHKLKNFFRSSPSPESRPIRTIHSRVNLFPYLLPDLKAHVLPNDNNRVCIASRKRTDTCRSVVEWSIDPSIIKASQQLLMRKKQKANFHDSNEGWAAKLTAVQESSKRMEEMMSNVSNRLAKAEALLATLATYVEGKC